MASFADAIPQFNPYIQQLPVEAMMAVGMEKQQRYDQGVQRIQSQIDQVAGLDVYRPEDKQHLQSKLNDLGSKLKTVAAGDFSNYQLVNSVAGMSKSIIKDPIVLAAVQSTAVIKNNEKVMEEARQKGELTPDNLDFYNKQLASYQNSGLVDNVGKPVLFNGRYDSYFDVFKFAKETFDAVKPDGMTFDQVYETDDQGNPKIDAATGKPIYSPVMIRMEKEGLFPEKVRQTLDQVFSDPRVSKQLRITGEYNYKSFSPEMIKQRISIQENNVIASENNTIADLTLRKTNAKTEEEKNKIDVQIGNVQNSISNIRSQYAKLKESADSNPEALRGYFHENDVRSRYTNMFSSMKTKQTNEDNPGWNANFKLEAAAFDRFKFSEDMKFKKQRAAAEDVQNLISNELAERKLAKDSFNATGGDWENSNMPSNFDKVSDFDANYNAGAENFVNSSNGFIWDTIYSKMPGNLARFQGLINKGNNRQTAIDIILKQDAEKQGLSDLEFKTTWGEKATRDINLRGADVPENVLMSFANYNTAKKGFEDLSLVKNQIDGATASETDKTILRVLSGNEVQPQTIKFRGQDINLSKQDVIDLAVYGRGYKHVFGFTIDDGARQSAKSAEDRLRRAGKGDILDYMMRSANIGDNDALSTVGEFFGSKGMFNITGALSRAARVVRQPFETIIDDYNSLVGDNNFDFSQVEKVYDAINNNQYSTALNRKAEILDQFYTVSPNLKRSLFTGNAEDDRAILTNVKRLTGAYAAANQNSSSTFEEFSELISGATEAKDVNLEIKTFPIAGGGFESRVVAYDGSKEFSMSIQPDEAQRFGIKNPYISRPVAILENRINSLGGYSSNGDPDEKDTYIGGDAYFQKVRGDFPQLINSPYNVMANMTTSNGLYFGKVLVQDPTTGKTSRIFTTPGGDIETIYNTIRSLDSNFVRSLILNQ